MIERLTDIFLSLHEISILLPLAAAFEIRLDSVLLINHHTHETNPRLIESILSHQRESSLVTLIRQE